jgi:hypothetical protein
VVHRNAHSRRRFVLPPLHTPTAASSIKRRRRAGEAKTGIGIAQASRPCRELATG